MTRKVYIRSRCEWAPEMGEPDIKAYVPPMELRRMGKILRRAVWTSHQALDAAGIDVPQAIVTGTDFGCIENSERFLTAAAPGSGVSPSPTMFMQSTHNTISSLIAIHLGCHGYNSTYSHEGSSLESALADAWMQISLGDIDNALVGWFDDPTPLFAKMLASRGETAVPRAVSIVLSSDGANAIAEMEMPSLKTRQQ